MSDQGDSALDCAMDPVGQPNESNPDEATAQSATVESAAEEHPTFVEVRPSEPVVPGPGVKAEIEALLHADNSRIGEVFRHLEEGLDAEEIRLELDLQTKNFVWSYERMISALRDGDLPTAPSVALNVARKFRSVLKSDTLSEDAKTLLRSNLYLLEDLASDEGKREQETVAARNATEKVEAKEISGIYVYAFPHYLQYPYHPESGRTLLKVGWSGLDVIKRFREQTRTTAVPEEPVLLRVYPVEGKDPDTGKDLSVSVEKRFHRFLEAADHDRSKARTGGTEWFLTSVRFLDEIAKTLSLEVTEVFDVGDVK